MSNNCTVSVLMSVYNENPKYLIQSIESILNQTFKFFEFLIINDGSSDRLCIEVLNDFSQIDHRIKLYNQNNKGLTRALNLGLKLCKGEIIFRQDSDDWSETNRLEKQIEFLNNNSHISLLGSSVMLHNHNGEKLWGKQLPQSTEGINVMLRDKNAFHHGASCFYKNIIDEVGPYREEFRYGQDYDFFIRVCEKYNGANHSDFLYNVRINKKSVSVKNFKAQSLNSIVAKKLAESRRLNEPENLSDAYNYAEKKIRTSNYLKIRLAKKGDYYLLNNDYLDAYKAYLSFAKKDFFNLSWFLKMVRMMIFIIFPFSRKFIFNFRR